MIALESSSGNRGNRDLQNFDHRGDEYPDKNQLSREVSIHHALYGHLDQRCLRPAGSRDRRSYFFITLRTVFGFWQMPLAANTCCILWYP